MPILLALRSSRRRPHSRSSEGFAALFSANPECKCFVLPATEFSIRLPTYFSMMQR